MEESFAYERSKDLSCGICLDIILEKESRRESRFGLLTDCDHVFCYGTNLGWDAAEALRPMGARAEVHEDFDAMLKAIVRNAQAGDHILVMSNGGFQGIHNKLLEALLSSSNG